MCSNDTPPPPDPYATAQAQNAVNKDAIATSAKYNQINQTNPFGSLSYTGDVNDPNNPRTQNVSLNPQLQGLLNTQTGISQNLSNDAQQRIAGLTTQDFRLPDYLGPSTTIDASQFQANGNIAQPGQSTVGNVQGGQIQNRLDPRNQGAGAINAANNAAVNASFQGQTALLQPGFQQAQDQLKGQLAAQGIPEGSNAYNDAIANLQRTQQGTMQQAANSAVGQGFGQGLQAQGQIFGQGLQSGQFTNSAQNQGFTQGLSNADLANSLNQQQFGQNAAQTQIQNQAQAQNFGQATTAAQNNLQQYQAQLQDQITARNQNFNEASAFLNGSPVAPSNPGFQGTSQYQAAQASPNAIGLAGQNYQAASQAAAAGNGAIFGALGTLGGAAILCWVAREVYGPQNPKWIEFRHWLLMAAPKWLLKLYRKYGERFAAWISDKPRVKNILRHFMDKCLVKDSDLAGGMHWLR